jgi:hypothetical protein
MYHICTPKCARFMYLQILLLYTAASASHMWDTIRALLPSTGRESVGTFARIQTFVEDHQLMTALKVPICPCGNTIYYDFEDPAIKSMFPFCGAHRNICQLCGTSKLVWDKDGNSKTRRYIYYLPFRSVHNHVSILCPMYAQMVHKICHNWA